MPARPALALALTVICGLMAGCASVKVVPQSRFAVAPGAVAPQRLVIGEFGFASSDRTLAKTGENLSATLRGHLKKRLVPLGLEVVATDAGSAPIAGEPPAWRVSGQFERIDRGSRLARLLVGCGLGASRIETRVRVEEVRGPELAPVATFRTAGFSGADPGLVFCIGNTPAAAANAALTFAMIAGAGPKADTERTARMIAAYMSELLAGRGYLDPKRVRVAKK